MKQDQMKRICEDGEDMSPEEILGLLEQWDFEVDRYEESDRALVNNRFVHFDEELMGPIILKEKGTPKVRLEVYLDEVKLMFWKERTEMWLDSPKCRVQLYGM